MTTVTLTDVRDEVLRLADAAPEGYAYVTEDAAEGGVSCSYVGPAVRNVYEDDTDELMPALLETGEQDFAKDSEGNLPPGCIFGQAFQNLGFTVDELERKVEGSGAGFQGTYGRLGIPVDVENDDDTQLLARFSSVQADQDAGCTWADAVSILRKG